jgi:nitroimidazol reductase NimA-like FMN-containing flavoprotein (pyridoxamine 5'-phosphate oxidase superfamily)
MARSIRVQPATVDQPRVPAVYGAPSPTERVDWAHVEERLAADREYWVTTCGEDGQPRSRPVSGFTMDGVIYIGGSRDARWARDLEHNPKVTIHLADVWDVVIVEGDATMLENTPPEMAERLAAASNAKFPEYGMTAKNFTGPGPYAVRPRIVYAWTSFPRDMTRFRFEA